MGLSPITTRSPATDDSCPSHYRIPDAQCRQCGCPIQPIDLTQSLDCLTSNIVKYAVRAGNKPGEPTLKDLDKCQHYLNLARERAKRRLGEQA
jgi:Protein of unknwon function (DUF3310)